MMRSDLTTLQLADAQFYIVVGIVVAVAAIATTALLSEKSRLSDGGVHAMTLTLLIGAAVGIGHIMIVMWARNSYDCMTKLAVFDFIMHTLALTLIMVLVGMWYFAVVIYKETQAGMPTNPANKT